MSEKSAISSWVNNSKRFSLYVDNTEKSIFHGLDDEITNEWIDFSRAIHEDKVDVIRRIMHLRTLYQDITKKLQNPNLYHATNFQQMLEAFECRLSSFKQAMRTEFDSLELSEHALSNDLVSVLSHFEKLSEETLVAQVRSGSDSKKSILEKQQKDINRKAVIGELDRKIVHLGRYGGWDIRDHDIFIKIWNQVEMKVNYTDELTIQLTIGQRKLLLNRLKFNLPAHNNTELDDHINWYVSFLELTAAKKRTVEEWKKDSTRNRTNMNQSTLVNEIFKPSESIDDINLDAGGSGGKNRETSEKEEEVREAAKQRIRAWRTEKATQQQLEKENQRKEALLSRKNQEQQSQQRQQSARIQIEKWKKGEELNKEVLIASSKCMERPKYVDPALLKKWQERDLEKAKNKHAKVEEVSQRQAERVRRQKEAAIPSVQRDVTRDSNRLLAPTVASEAAALTADELDAAEYRRENIGAHCSAMALTGRDLNTLGRAVPAWMKHN